jgi:hypothetical protein
MFPVQPDLWPQILKTAAALLTFLAAIARLISIKGGGISFARKRLQNSQRISDMREISYLDEKAKNNCINSIVFSAETGCQAPIHIVNLMFNCYDPALAMYIYSRAKNYIKFDNDDQLLEPKRIRSKWIIVLIAFMLLTSLSLAIVSLLGVFNGLKIILSLIMSFSKNINSAIYIFLFFVIFFTIVFVITTVIGFWGFRYSLNEFSFLDKVKKFYENYDQWKAAEEKKRN